MVVNALARAASMRPSIVAESGPDPDASAQAFSAAASAEARLPGGVSSAALACQVWTLSMHLARSLCLAETNFATALLTVARHLVDDLSSLAVS